MGKNLFFFDEIVKIPLTYWSSPCSAVKISHFQVEKVASGPCFSSSRGWISCSPRGQVSFSPKYPVLFLSKVKNDQIGTFGTPLKDLPLAYFGPGAIPPLPIIIQKCVVKLFSRLYEFFTRLHTQLSSV